jgi:hypothetical protein
MKRIVLLLALCPMWAGAQVTVLTEDFDAYTAGNYAGLESSIMDTWSLTPGGADDCLISDTQASSGANSINIVGQSGPIDALIVFPSSYTAGQIRFSMKFFVAAGSAGYFNCQESTAPGLGWKCDVFFDNAGGGYVAAAGSQGPAFTYTPDSWMDVVVDADLSADQGTVTIDGNVVHTFVWSTGVAGDETFARWGGLNLYAYGPNDEAADYYIDDIILEDLTDYTTVDESYLLEFSVYPNPTAGDFTVQWGNDELFDVNITDLAGKTVYTQTQVTSKSIINLDLTAGTYIVNLNNDSNQMVEKLVIK